MSSKPIALLVMHYGTPASLEEVPAYYTHIRHGRPPAPEDLEDLVSRYRAIGGPSPLKAISEAQAQAILRGIREAGVDAKLYVGAKHTSPFIGDAVRQIAADGIERVIALVLAPHYSTFSVAAYRKYALETRDEVAPDMKIDFVERWGELPEFVSALAERVRASLKGAEDFSDGSSNLDQKSSALDCNSSATRATPFAKDSRPFGPEISDGESLAAHSYPRLAARSRENASTFDEPQPIGPAGRESLTKGEALVTGDEGSMGSEPSANGAALETLQPVGPTGREALAKGEALVTGDDLTNGAEDFWSRFEEPAEKSSAPSAPAEAWDPDETLVIFSAHSLPKRIMAEGDPYIEELLATSRLVASETGVKNWRFAFQSASKTGEPWLGPDILDVINEEQGNYKNFLACTVGFVSDHLEVLYDLDIESRDHCEKLGLNFRRAATIGPDEAVMMTLAQLCAKALTATSNALPNP